MTGAPETRIEIRQVRADDRAAIDELLEGLDLEARYRRWFTGNADGAEPREWAAHPERESAIGLLAFAGQEPVGQAVLIPASDARGEVAFEVAPTWRHLGIAGALLDLLFGAAARQGLVEIYVDVLPENADMLAVLRAHGEHDERSEDGILTVTLPVPPSLVGGLRNLAWPVASQ